MNGAISGPIKLRVRLIYPEIAIFQVGLFVALIYRGLDYLTPPSDTPTSLTVVEQALPLHTWGALLLASGVAGLLGLAWPRFPITALAHGAAVSLYAAFAVGSLLSIADRIDRSPSVFVWTVCGAALAAAVVTLVVVEWKARAWRSAAWVLLAATVTSAVITLAAASGTYGWRTASDWIFVLAVAHAVMADAAMDAWRDLRRQETADAEPSI